MAMNALSIYLTTTRQIMTGDLEDPKFWSDINRLVLYLRQSLTCNVCGQLLKIPMSSTVATCQHHICKDCLGGKMRLKPSCSWCKDHSKFMENTQLRILLQSYKSLCDYLTVIEVDSKWGHLNSGSATGVSMSFSELITEGKSIADKFSYTESAQQGNNSTSGNNGNGLKPNAKIAQKLATSKLLSKPLTSSSSNATQGTSSGTSQPAAGQQIQTARPLAPGNIINKTRLINLTSAVGNTQQGAVLKPNQVIAAIRPANLCNNPSFQSSGGGIQTFHIAPSGTIIRPIGISTTSQHQPQQQQVVISPTGATIQASSIRPCLVGTTQQQNVLTAQQIHNNSTTTSTGNLNLNLSNCVSATQPSNHQTHTTIRLSSPPLAVHQSAVPQQPQQAVKTQTHSIITSAGPVTYDLHMIRTTQPIVTAQQHQLNTNNSQQNHSSNNQTKSSGSSSGKAKPKRRGCRCGLATPNPGKLTCCGQRCPCYVEGKGCLECKCRGCRNPHKRNESSSSGPSPGSKTDTSVSPQLLGTSPPPSSHTHLSSPSPTTTTNQQQASQPQAQQPIIHTISGQLQVGTTLNPHTQPIIAQPIHFGPNGQPQVTSSSSSSAGNNNQISHSGPNHSNQNQTQPQHRLLTTTSTS